MKPEARIITAVLEKISAKLSLLDHDFPHGSGANQPGQQKDFLDFLKKIRTELTAPVPEYLPLSFQLNNPYLVGSRRISSAVVEQVFSEARPLRVASPKGALKEMQECLGAIEEKLKVLQKRLIVSPENYLENLPLPKVTLPKAPTPGAAQASQIKVESLLKRRKPRALRRPRKKMQVLPWIVLGGTKGRRQQVDVGGKTFFLTKNQVTVVKALEKSSAAIKAEKSFLSKLSLKHTTMAQIFRMDRRDALNSLGGKALSDREIAELLFEGFPPQPFELKRKF